MDLDVGKLQARDVVQLGSLTIASLFVGCLGAYLAWLVLPEYGTWAGWRVLLASFGGGVALLGGGCAVTVARLTYRDWTSYHERLADWHDVAITAYEYSHGQETVTETTTWELTTSAPRDILLVALSVHRSIKDGSENAHTVRALQGEKWIGREGHDIRLGDVNTTQAQRMSKALVDIGLIQRGGERSAGRWVPETTDEVIERVMAGWHKIRT
jgi:hypothetical protein